VNGLTAYPARTLVERALDLLLVEPCGAERLSREVMGLPNASRAIAERLAVALLGADPRIHRLNDGRWAVVTELQGSPLIEECAFAVVDCETTGVRAAGSDRITDIAVVVVQGARRELVFESLVNPGFPIPMWVTGITGITDMMVRSAPPFEEIAEQVLAALAGRVFVAHNVRFDWRFVTAEVRRSSDLTMDGPRLCTVRLARRLLPHLESRSLDSLTYHFGLTNPARHRATGDALATAELLQRLLGMARDAGARTLADLEGMMSGRGVPSSEFRVRKKRSALPRYF
jgi:DNA polymerase-3 subunit epsilon